MNPTDLFKKGYNCAQSTFVPNAQKFNIDIDLAYKLIYPFGGGICSTDNICGAVSGTVASIGLYTGSSKVDDKESSGICHQVIKEFTSRFKEKHGSLNCTSLIGYNLSLDEDREKAVASNVFQDKCVKYIESAQNLLNEILTEKGINIK